MSSPIVGHGFSRGTREILGFVEDFDFRRISVTALGPALARGEFTDIPLAKEMLSWLRAKDSDSPQSHRDVLGVAPLVESRFKAINHILDEFRATQILELAAGFSPRGMEYVQRGVVYVEVDLPESSAVKREIVTAVRGQIPANLHLCAASVLDRAALLECCTPFIDRPVAVTTEGLLRYLTFEEKTQLAANVRDILSRYGGIWITVDIHLRKWAHGRTDREKETARLGRDLDPNYFDGVDHARTFFEDCGFQVESRPLLDGIRDRVISLPNASGELLSELTDRRIFILRLND